MAKHKIACTMSAAALIAGSGMFTPITAWAEGDDSGLDGRNVVADWTLAKDYDRCFNVTHIESDITINLNGHKITCPNNAGADPAAGIMVNLDDSSSAYTVTITGNGTVAATANTKDIAAVYNKRGTVNINGGTYISEKWYTIVNADTMTINDGSVSQGEGTKPQPDGTNASTIVVSGSAEDQVANLTINGGTIEQPYSDRSVIKTEYYANAIINGGTIKSAKGFIAQAIDNVEVNGGEFIGGDKDALFNIYPYGDDEEASRGTLTINGGTFKGAEYVVRKIKDSEDRGSLVINGGSFENTDSKAFKALANTTDGDKVDTTVSGGTFSWKIGANRLAEGLTLYKSGGKYVVAEPAEVKLDEPVYVAVGDQIDLYDYMNESAIEFGSYDVNDLELFSEMDGHILIARTAGAEKIAIDITDAYGNEAGGTLVINVYDEAEMDELTAGLVASVLANEEITGFEFADDENAETLKEAVKAGEALRTEVVFDESTDTAAEEAIAEAVAAEEGNVAAYYDINVELLAGEDDSERMIGRFTDLGDSYIDIDVDLPEDLEAVADGYTRMYYVVYYHDDAVNTLNATEYEGKVTFSANQFSTYALAYIDTYSAPEDNGPVVNPGADTDTDAGANAGAATPDTGAMTNTGVTGAVELGMTGSAMGLAVMLWKKYRNR